MRAALLTLARFARDRLAAVVLVGVLAVPAIYGGVLVWGYWDPYARSGHIPAALVNLDEPVQTVDGSDLAAGDDLERVVLTSGTLDWTATDAETAAQGLEDKTYYVVVTIPPGFSAQVASLSSADPQQAQIEVRTNDAGNYLVGVLAQDASEAVEGTAGSQVQADYLDVVYGLLGQAKDAGGEVGGSAQELADGTQQAADAAREVADGAAQVADGVAQVADALADVDDAVQDVPALADSLATVAASVAARTSGAADAAQDVSARLTALEQQLAAAGQPDAAARVAEIRDSFEATVVPAVEDAADDAADIADDAGALSDLAGEAVTAADRANAQGQALADGARSVADGSEDLATVLADQLAPGAQQLADGLAQAAEQLDVPITEVDRETFGQVLSRPVTVERVRDNPIAHFGDGFTSYFAGLGLFVGAVFVFLVLSPLDRRGQLWGAGPLAVAGPPLLAGGAVVLLQAALLFGALLLVGVGPDAPWVLLGVLAASAVCFVALVQLLKAAFGLVGEFVGVILLVLQVAAGEGAYPIQTFGPFFQAVHPFLPMSWTNDAVRRSVAGGPLTPYVWVDVALLLGTAAVAFGLTCLAARGRERWTPARLRPSVELV